MNTHDWETEFRNRDFFTLMNGNAPITDIIAYIKDLLTAQRAELARKIEDIYLDEGVCTSTDLCERILALLQDNA